MAKVSRKDTQQLKHHTLFGFFVLWLFNRISNANQLNNCLNFALIRLFLASESLIDRCTFVTVMN
ncbi:MAG: hypothetical protein QE487_03515 [Fluviicola sp.]|nr:hypothetical protein [Fluviicola sp.]